MKVAAVPCNRVGHASTHSDFHATHKSCYSKPDRGGKELHKCLEQKIRVTAASRGCAAPGSETNRSPALRLQCLTNSLDPLAIDVACRKQAGVGRLLIPVCHKLSCVWVQQGVAKVPDPLEHPFRKLFDKVLMTNRVTRSGR